MKTLFAVAFAALSFSATAQTSFPSFDYDSVKQHKMQIQPSDIFMTKEEFVEKQAQNWAGIFYDKKEQAYTTPTKIKGARSKNAYYEEDGYRVRANNKDRCLLLFSGLEFSKQTLATIALPATFEPNSSHAFSSNNIEYRLYSQGEPAEDYFNNYKLFLEISENGNSKTQLLAFLPQAYNDVVTPMLISDLDKDGKLDFVFSILEEGSTFGIVLYLSKSAKEGNLLEIAAQYVEYLIGC